MTVTIQIPWPMLVVGDADPDCPAIAEVRDGVPWYVGCVFAPIGEPELTPDLDASARRYLRLARG